MVDGGSTDGTVEHAAGRGRCALDVGARRGTFGRGEQRDRDGDRRPDRMAERRRPVPAGRACGRRRGFSAEHARAEWGSGRCGIIDADGHEIRSGVTAYKNFFLRRYSFPCYLTHNFVSAPATFVKRSAFDEVGFVRQALQVLDGLRRLAPARRDAATRSSSTPSSPSLQDGRGIAEHERLRDPVRRALRERAPVCRRAPDSRSRANAVISRLIVLAYRAMRFIRGRRTDRRARVARARRPATCRSGMRRCCRSGTPRSWCSAACSHC